MFCTNCLARKCCGGIASRDLLHNNTSMKYHVMLDEKSKTPNRTGQRSRPRWLVRSAALAAVLGTLAAGCGDDSGDNDDVNGGAAGESNVAGAATSGSAAGGTHGGGTHPAIGGAGMGGEGAADTAHPAFAVEGDRRISYTPTNDLEFSEFFIAHHQMAIDMALEVIERGSNADVKAMAQKMIDVQRAEVLTLETVRAQLSGTVPLPPVDVHAEIEMESIGSASGTKLDEMFLLEMIPHHAAGLAPAHRSLPFLESAELQQMASDMMKAQATEIGEMHALLRKLGAMGAGEDMGASDPARPDFGLVGDRRLPLTPENDVEFIDFFVPHHEMAVEMAEHVVAHGQSPDVKAMATMMADAQSAEITLMREKRAELAGSANSPAMPDDPHAMREMEAMSTMSGAELDRMFLQEMIVHHSSALPTSHRAKPHVTDAELRALSDTMFDAQATEIGEMQLMLDE